MTMENIEELQNPFGFSEGHLLIQVDEAQVLYTGLLQQSDLRNPSLLRDLRDGIRGRHNPIIVDGNATRFLVHYYLRQETELSRAYSGVLFGICVRHWILPEEN